MGAVNDIWTTLDAHLVENALASQMGHTDSFLTDERRKIAEDREGRVLCNEIVEAVLMA